MFPGVLVYERPGERRYFIPAGSRVWNRTRKGWTSWVARTGSYKRFLDGRWWNETLICDGTVGRYYDIAAPPIFQTAGISYVDLYLDVEKRRGRTTVVDRHEWNMFVDGHPLAPEIGPLVEYGMREARHFGPASWRAAMDRMEGECRRWMRDTVRERLLTLGIAPSTSPLPPAALAAFVTDMDRVLGTRLPRRRLAGVPSMALGRAVFETVTGSPSVGRRPAGPGKRTPRVRLDVPRAPSSTPRAPAH